MSRKTDVGRRYYIGQKYGNATLLSKSGKAPLYRYHMQCECGIEFSVARIGRAILCCHVCKHERQRGITQKVKLGSVGEQIAALGRRIADYESAVAELRELIAQL